MRLVSNNTDADVERRKARRNLGFALRKLAANIMRISRGAGKPYDLGLELARCIDAYQEYHDAHGFYPPEDEVARMLDFERDWPEPVDDPDRRELAWREDMDELELLQRSRDHAERTMQRASLQMVAAMLVGQDLQRRRGQDALESAISSDIKGLALGGRTGLLGESSIDAQSRKLKAALVHGAPTVVETPLLASSQEPLRERQKIVRSDQRHQADKLVSGGAQHGR